MMYNPDDEKMDLAEETGILQENDISEPAPETEEPAETPPELPAQENE
jgi:hypothetical protein